MTIGEILGMDADKLAAMSDAELESHLSKYFCVTRPEVVRQRQPNLQSKSAALKLSPAVLQGMELLKGAGVDMSVFLSHKPKRR